MSSRDRDTKSFQDKLKVFFRKPSAPLAAQNELVVTAELRRDLCRETPLHRRLRAIKEVGEKVLHTRVHEGVIEKIWECTRDLLDESNVEARHAALGLLRCIAEGPAELLIMRTILFEYLRQTTASQALEDYQLRFRLLHALTNSGKNINCVEEKIGPFILEWLPQIQNPTHIIEFVQLVINVVKFNAVYLDEEIVHGIVNHACYLCVYSSEQGVVQGCLSLLEAVVSYSILPRDALRTFVAALSRTVNLEHYCQNSWKLMRCVVGADIGYAALQEMVDILVSAGDGGAGGDGEEADAGLVRGAVFYMNMALWGPRRVQALHVSYLAVLPAFLKALRVRQPVVTYEVVVALQSLVARAPLELHEPAWDSLLQILRAILAQDKSFEPPNELIHSRLHDLISAIEQLHDAGQYQGDVDALLDLLDCCGHDRPEASTMRLVSARAAALSGGGAWASAALALGERYVRLERRLPVRLHAFAMLQAAIRRNGVGHGEELAERVGVPLCAMCALDADVALRAAAARAAPDLARLCQPDACVDLVDLLEKILNRPFEMYVSDVAIPAEADVSDAQLAAGGLLALLHERLLRAPAALAARALLVLLDHLDHHYRQPAIFHHHPDIRLKIFDMLFGLRANQLNCVGFCYDSSGGVVAGPAALRLRPVCSPLLLVEPYSVRGQPHQPLKDLPPGACAVPGGRVARVLHQALTHEAEWAVLAHVLRALPHLLQARALALGRRAADLDLLAATLCSMVTERGGAGAGGGGGGGGGGRLPVSEFHAVALPALAALSSYHAFLEPQTQQRIVRCLLKYGMVLRSPQPYINALTLFALETRDTMVKMLPEVLLDLSKISDTKVIASPMLEFLSTLTRLPRVFASFVEDQYMSVFAILLPYTNPSRYNHYVVSLAHHVIAAWFLKCRLSYRRNFVRFIIHGLHNYIIMPFEEQMQYKGNNFQQSAAAAAAAASVNEDSSNRQRSSSLGSKAVSRAPLAGARPAGAPASFHVELTETCVDLLARYTFTPCSVKPHRSDTAEFLFNGGQSTTWLVGHKLVTITTSGCLQNSIKQGLCERCATLCRQHAESAASPLPPLLPPDDAPPQPPLTPPVQVQVNDSTEQPPATTNGNHLQVMPAPAAPPPDPPGAPPPEVKRYSKYSLQHSRSTETSCSSLSISELLPPSSGHTTRQNSAENKSTDPVVDALSQFSQRFDKISKEVDAETGGWSRVGALSAAGACPCFCARWAELHVRSPTGDVSWLMRLQNQVSWSQVQEWPLQDVLALLSPPLSDHTASSSSGLDLQASEGSPRSPRSSRAAPRPPPAPTDLHKSSSDSGVGSERRMQSSLSHSSAPPAGQPPRMSSTQPINIPGSPQRQSSSSTTDEDDMLLIVPEGKSRHPVRRSNSSPEMSSSWKRPEPPPGNAHAPHGALPPHAQHATHPLDMILLPSVEPTGTSMSLHAAKKPPKKSDMRVSCEAIPEEMCGTSPQPPPAPPPAPHTHPHPHLMTYNSDPGSVGAETDGEGAAAADGPHAHHQLQKTRSDSTVAAGGAGAASAAGGAEREELPPLARSKRSNTISVMSPTRRSREAMRGAASSMAGGAGGAGGAGLAGGGVSPSFAFLQLYHNMSTYPISPPVPGEAPAQLNPLSERPLKLSGVQHERTIKNLDLVPPLDTYKVGVLYVGAGQQDSETAILRNEHGSVRYSEFLRALGSLVPLAGARHDPTLFVSLDAGRDGRYTYVWSDDIMQVLFHVATAMPSSPHDPACNEKRKYIGNDYVSIVYNDSGAEFNIHTIKGQFNLCIVVVEPLEHGMNLVSVRTKDERIRTKFLAHLHSSVVSDHSAPVLARQQALHCALASQISQSLKGSGLPYASNSLERLRIIKRLRARAQDERLAAAARAPAPYAAAPQRRRVAIDDFNDYT